VNLLCFSGRQPGGDCRFQRGRAGWVKRAEVLRRRGVTNGLIQFGRARA
jgi:hypothetical protein